MYEEHQKKLAYNQAHRIEPHHDQNQKKPQGNQKQITATSSQKHTAGGATSSAAGKAMGNDRSQDSGR